LISPRASSSNARAGIRNIECLSIGVPSKARALLAWSAARAASQDGLYSKRGSSPCASSVSAVWTRERGVQPSRSAAGAEAKGCLARKVGTAVLQWSHRVAKPTVRGEPE